MPRVKLTAEMLASLKEAVRYMEKSWDAQRDLELELDHDIDGMGKFIEDYAVIGADSVDMDELKAILNFYHIEFED